MTNPSTIGEATRLLLDPAVDVEDAVERHFSPSFRRRANGGPWGGRAELAERMTELRKVMTSGTIEVHEELVDGPVYADRHTIAIAMADGTSIHTEVYLFARHDADGRFSEIQEATVSLSGDDAALVQTASA